MKQFKDIIIGEKFTLNTHPGEIFTKTEKGGGNCCDPQYNAVSINHKILVHTEKKVIEVK